MTDTTRFAQFCGMLGSDFDGERANAANFATSWLKNHNLTWQDVADALADRLNGRNGGRRDRRPEFEESPELTDRQRKIDRILKEFPHFVNAWEREFLQSIRDRQHLSPKQEAVWQRIITRRNPV